MDINITIRSAPVSVLPVGFDKFTVRPYPIHGYGVDLDAVQRGVDMWAIVPVWCIETQSWSAVKGNVSMIGKTDIDKLTALQPKDSHTLNEKMGWLVSSKSGIAPMWTGGLGDWDTAQAYYAGSQLWAGQDCAASHETFKVAINGETVTCRKLYTFQPSDWKKAPQDAPWLYPWCSVARKSDNSLSYDWGRGRIRTMSQVLNYPAYEFVGPAKPSAFYVPAAWLV